MAGSKMQRHQTHSPLFVTQPLNEKFAAHRFECGEGLGAAGTASIPSAFSSEPLPRGEVIAKQSWIKACLLVLDLSVLWLCFFLGRVPAWVRDDLSFLDAFLSWWGGNGAIRLGLFGLISSLLIVWLGAVKGHYSHARRKPWWDEVRELLLAVIAVAMIDAMLVFFGKWQFSRLWLGSSWVQILVAMPVARLVVKSWLIRKGWFQQPYILIGSPAYASEAAAALASEPLMGFTPVALFSPVETDERGPLTLGGQTLQPVPLTQEVVAMLSQPCDCQLVIALDALDSAPLKDLALHLMLTRDDVVIVPPLTGLPLLGMELSHFFSHEVLLLRARNNLKRRSPRILKRFIDILGATALLLLLSPLLVAVAVRVWLENGGPVFFVQPRVGRNGRVFPFIKFRSMVVDAEAALNNWRLSHPELWQQYRANNFKLADDPRVTRVGRWIRRTSIDELPQLWNVLRGDMSLIGPRPLLEREVPEYGESISIYNAVRPGMSGLWQINGRSNTTFEQRIAMDRWYVRNWSLWYDLVILVRTVRVVLKGEGAV
jgi:undecaprenyl-phosphate galactose phosphotransferase